MIRTPYAATLTNRELAEQAAITIGAIVFDSNHGIMGEVERYDYLQTGLRLLMRDGRTIVIAITTEAK